MTSPNEIRLPAPTFWHDSPKPSFDMPILRATDAQSPYLVSRGEGWVCFRTDAEHHSQMEVLLAEFPKLFVEQAAKAVRSWPDKKGWVFVQLSPFNGPLACYAFREEGDRQIALSECGGDSEYFSLNKRDLLREALEDYFSRQASLAVVQAVIPPAALDFRR